MRAGCGSILLLALAAVPAAAEWKREVVVPGMNGGPPGVAPHGLTGITAAPDGTLLAASVTGAGIFRFNPVAGTFTEEVAAPEGQSDDVAIGADGTLVWTAMLDGELRVRSPGGAIKVLAKDLPAINPVAFAPDGKLYAGQTGAHDSVFEVDPATGKLTLVGRGFGGVNGFAPDGRGGLFTPLMTKGAVGRIDLKSGEMTEIADKLGRPAAVKRNSLGELYVIDWQNGRVTFVHPESGETKRIATVAPPLDNLAIGADDTIYVTQPMVNGIVAVNPVSGVQRTLFQGKLAAPAGLAVAENKGKPVLLVADAYGYRTVELTTGEIVAPSFDPAVYAAGMVAVGDTVIALSNVRRGTLVILDRLTGRPRHTLGGFKAPMGVVIENDASFLVADYATGEIIRVRPGAAIERQTVFGGLNGPVGLAVRDGEIFVTEATEGTLLAIRPDSGERAVLATNLMQPEGLALLPDGRVAVAEVGSGRLLLLDPATVSGKADIAVVAENLPMGDYFTASPAPVYLPSGVAADAAGAIYVTCDRDNTVLKFTPP